MINPDLKVDKRNMSELHVDDDRLVNSVGLNGKE